jgi:hypothetical protein
MQNEGSNSNAAENVPATGVIGRSLSFAACIVLLCGKLDERPRKLKIKN